MIFKGPFQRNSVYDSTIFCLPCTRSWYLPVCFGLVSWVTSDVLLAPLRGHAGFSSFPLDVPVNLGVVQQLIYFRVYIPVPN